MGGIKSPTAVKNFFYDVRTPIFGDMLGLDVDIDHVMRKIKPELRETVEYVFLSFVCFVCVNSRTTNEDW